MQGHVLYCLLQRKMSQREYSSIYQEEDFATFFYNSFCGGPLLHWSVLESVRVSNMIPYCNIFGVPAWVRMMQNSPSLLQLKQEEVWKNKCFCTASTRSLLPCFVGTATSMFVFSLFVLFAVQIPV